MLFSNMSPLWVPFKERLEELVKDINITNKERYILKRRNVDIGKGDSFYYAIKTGRFYAFLDHIVPALNSPFIISGVQNRYDGEVEIKAEVKEKYKSLVQEHLAKFCDSEKNGASRFKIQI